MTAERSREKSLENGRCFVLRAARRRVIIELSPGEPETTPNTTPGASYVRRKGTVMTGNDATDIGFDHGLSHAAYVDAYTDDTPTA
jgi:hypothetical protein